MTVDIGKATIQGQLIPEHPGVILKQTIFPELHLPLAQIERRLELSHAELAKVLNGKEDIGSGLADKIAALVGGDPNTWLSLQAVYNVFLAKKAQVPDGGPGPG
jgi:addiction module HigA family antidote